MENENTLSFQIPVIPANKNYKVEVRGTGQTLSFGDVLVDVSNFTTSPTETPIVLDGKAYMDIILPQPAPTSIVQRFAPLARLHST